MRLTVPLIAALACPMTATAHPHIFVEAEVRVVFDNEGRVSVALDWYYDDLFSLLVTSDLGLDMDGVPVCRRGIVFWRGLLSGLASLLFLRVEDCLLRGQRS